MNDASSLSTNLLSTTALQRVDSLRARFEEVWKSGQRPRLEEFLNGTQGGLAEQPTALDQGANRPAGPFGGQLDGLERGVAIARHHQALARLA